MAKLILVGLPIGNLSDITERVRKALENGKFFFVEDTRTFKSLLDHLGINSKEKIIDSFHEHSDQTKIDKCLRIIREKNDVYFASEAGSPVLSDPGYPLVKAAIEQQIEVDIIPCVTSLMCALELSGLPTVPFSFHGFLPREDNKKIESFKKALAHGGSIFFFESPHRLLKSVETLVNLLNSEASVVIARELTKKFQTVYRFKASEFAEYSKEMMIKGECIIGFHNSTQVSERKINDEKLIKLANDVLDQKGKKKALAKLLAEITQSDSKEIYSKLI